MTEKADRPPARTVPRVDRRLFLRGAGVAAVAAPLTATAAETLRQPTNHQAPPRYKESEHVKRFYDLNRR
jgi:hypothetical protein